ncbi:Helix-turn-helix domain-containing protein [Dyadobacter sp. SG02]|uniref:helix-turn-helix domain-containing protein n=1 Tax=Dyadobacter sp. SG02 TaxID=1855291 RepID=UPI0008AB18AA|nr:AraC family transcriptional regulator [Dyadobacter sp. SG02]SEJ59739.1 Helix-turn-helix domain-containing protein [Dyadobacter sp. SG02]
MQILPTATYLGNTSATCQANGIWTSVTCYTRENLPNVSLHAHANPHVTVLLAGATLEKRQGEEHYRQAGEAVFFHAGEPHENSRTMPGSRNFNIEFAPDFFAAYGVGEEKIGEAINRNPLAALAFLRAYCHLSHDGLLAGDSIAMAVIGLMDRHCRVCRQPPQWVRQVSELLQDRWNEQVGLQELSIETGVHPVTISRYFSRYFGGTLSDYMRKLRVKNTLTMIKNTPYTLTRIAYEAGFTDQAHFTKVFKEVTGFLPKEYRAA